MKRKKAPLESTKENSFSFYSLQTIFNGNSACVCVCVFICTQFGIFLHTYAKREAKPTTSNQSNFILIKYFFRSSGEREEKERKKSAIPPSSTQQKNSW